MFTAACVMAFCKSSGFIHFLPRRFVDIGKKTKRAEDAGKSCEELQTRTLLFL